MDDGWCEGELNGARGMFPDNFVHLLPVAVAPVHQPPPASEPPPSTSAVPLRSKLFGSGDDGDWL